MRIANPYRYAIISIVPFCLLLFLVAVIPWERITGVKLGLLAWLPFAMVGFLVLVVWMVGRLRSREAVKFLRKGQHIVYWRYTPNEWMNIVKKDEGESKKDWLYIWVGLFFLALIIGALCSIWLESKLLTIGIACVIGFLVGGTIALGNYVAIKARVKDSLIPGEVAIAHNGLYISGDFWPIDGIRSVRIQRSKNPRLLIDVDPGSALEMYRYRWIDFPVSVPLPSRLEKEVRDIFTREGLM